MFYNIFIGCAGEGVKGHDESRQAGRRAGSESVLDEAHVLHVRLVLRSLVIIKMLQKKCHKVSSSFPQQPTPFPLHPLSSIAAAAAVVDERLSLAAHLICKADKGQRAFSAPG